MCDKPDFRVVQGVDRFHTAALLAERRIAEHGPVSTVVIASGFSFIDAIAAGPALGDDAVVLLTHANRIPDRTAEALRDINPDRIVIAGGPAVVHAEVARQLWTYTRSVTRLAGSDRYATAAALLPHGPTQDLRLAPGRDMREALTAAGFAAAQGQGLLLAEATTHTGVAAGQLRRHRPGLLLNHLRLHNRHPDWVAALRRDGVTRDLQFGGWNRAAEQARIEPGGVLFLATQDGVVDAVSAAALSVPSSGPTFASFGTAADHWTESNFRYLIEKLEPSEVWLIGRAGNVDQDPLVRGLCP